MNFWAARIDGFVRSLLDHGASSGGRAALARLCGCTLLFGCCYGVVMGTYSGVSAQRGWQLLYSGGKVPLLLLGTFVICLPSYFVLNTIAGLRRDFPEALRALLGTQLAMTLVLCSLAPFVGLWYCSLTDYHAAILA